MVSWTLIAAVIALIYILDKYLLNYWSRRGIPQISPRFLIGNMGDILSGKKSFGTFLLDMYNKSSDQKILGIYFSYRKNLIINDPKLIHDVLIKDFDAFHDRGMMSDEQVDPIALNLFALEGQRWRDLRKKMTPAFSTAKLKGMHPILLNTVKVLQVNMAEKIAKGNDIFEFYNLYERYIIDVIINLAFGVENDCINDDNNVFLKTAHKMMNRTIFQSIVDLMTSLAPNLTALFKLRMIDLGVEKFLKSVIQQTIDYREANKDYVRNDFMQLFIQLKNQGYVTSDDKSDASQSDLKKLTFNEIYANAALFFFAAIETSVSTMNMAICELIRNPEILKKVQDEIDNVLNSRDISELTYDDLNEMKYLDLCLDETLRKHPVAPMLNREAVRDYTFAGTNMTVEKGTPILIPLIGIQRNPEIYEKPMEFVPERFLNSSNGNGKGDGIFYSPFGSGPRHCIGMRMGKIQSKLGLVTVLAKFNLEMVDTKYMYEEVEYDPNALALRPKIPLKYKATVRN